MKKELYFQPNDYFLSGIDIMDMPYHIVRLYENDENPEYYINNDGDMAFELCLQDDFNITEQDIREIISKYDCRVHKTTQLCRVFFKKEEDAKSYMMDIIDLLKSKNYTVHEKSERITFYKDK